MIDLVYILGNESQWHNREIMYSIRSCQKHLKHFGNVFIIGTKPDFLNNQVTEIPYKDIYGNKARNIMSKILCAAQDKQVSNDFILFNDDYFLLKDVSAKTYPYYYKNTLDEALIKNEHNYEFFQHVQQTKIALEQGGYNTLNFDSHYPIVYNSSKLIQVINKYNWNLTFGLIMKSTYCNTLKIKGEFKLDCKINHPHVYDNWPNVVKDLDMFSIGDRCINKGMEMFLHSLFPDKSIYEL